MSEKILNSRIVNKHDSEENWLKATGFTPKQGELIVYDIDENYSYERIKIGDGVHNVNDLPFCVVQPDWYVNDENNPAYIKNRTHWMESVLSEIIPETSVDLSTGSVMGVLNGVSLNEGSTYIVTWDGQEYTCIARDDGYGEIYIGNQTLSDGWSFPETIVSDEPFFIWAYEDSNNEIRGSTENHTFILSGYVDSAHKLDERYIPDTIARVSELNALIGDTSVSDQISNAIAEIPKQVQSNLSQTDNTATDYVRGIIRQESLPEGYPYENIVQTLVGEESISDATLQTGSSDVANTYKVRIDILNNRMMTLGQSYMIDLDGKQYYATYEETGGYNSSGTLLTTLDAVGNPYYYNNQGWFQDNGLPFLIIPQYSYANLITNKKYTKIIIYEVNTEITTMQEKYLPTSVPSIASATVGQTVMVSAVDDTGKPTSWEVADLLTSSYVESVVETKQITSKQKVNVVASEDIVANEIFYATDPVPSIESITSMVSATYNTFSHANASSNNGVMVVCENCMTSGSENHNIRLYEAIGSQLTFKNSKSRVVDDDIHVATLNPDGTLLVIGGNFTGKAKVYSISNYAFTYVSDIPADANGGALSNAVQVAKFSPDGSLLILSTDYSGEKAKLYSVSGTSITYVSDIGDNEATCATFSPDGNMLVLGYSQSSKAKLYSVSDTTVEYISTIGNTNYVTEAAFSPNGDLLITSADTTTPIKMQIHSVSGTDITYISDILDADGSVLGDVYYCDCMSFSHDGSMLVIGCHERTNYAYCVKMYTVSGTSVNYLQDIPAYPNGNQFDNNIAAMSFSGDDRILAISSNDGYNGCKGYVLGEKYIAYPVSKNFDRENYIVCLSDTAIAQNSSVSAYQIFEYVGTKSVDMDSLKPKCTTITLSASAWTGDTNPYSQVITINGIDVNSKVDLQPTAYQIVEMQNNDIALMAENDNGVVTVYAIGGKPTVDYTMQALITEVTVV